MRETMLLAALLAAAYCGFTALAVAQPRHWTRVIGEGAPSQRQVWRLRGGGYVLLLVAFALALLRDGASFGIVLWATAISLSAMSVAFTLTWRPRWALMIVAPLGQPGGTP